MLLFLILHLEKVRHLTVDNLECMWRVQSPQEDDRHEQLLNKSFNRLLMAGDNFIPRA